MKTLLILFIAIFAYSFELDINTFEATFTQTIKNEQNRSFKYSGKIVAKKPNFALWTYEKPAKKEIYIKGSNVAVYEPNLKQVTVSNSYNIPNIYDLAKKAKQVSKNEFETILDGVKITFVLLNGIPERIYYKDKLENSVDIAFSNLKTNQQISDKYFDFAIPQGVDILRQ